MHRKKIYLLLLLWFFLPLLRYFNPKGGAIDGVRHFMEVVYPLSVLAGIGAYQIFRIIERRIIKTALLIFFSLNIVLLIRNLIIYHPYQTDFFNPLIGGIKGANGKFDIDYWGTPQREAMVWLNKNAPQGATVHVVMAQSSAGIYLRQDLLDRLNTKDFRSSDYTVILNRLSFLGYFQHQNLAEYFYSKVNHPIYVRSIEEVPLVWIFKN